MIGLPRTRASNAARVQAVVAPLAAACRGRVVFLVDGDRTLTPDDTSRTFLSRAGGDPLVIKRRFQRDGYSFDAFRFHAQKHLELGEGVFAAIAPSVAADTPIHPGAVSFLRAAIAVGHVFVVSSGIPRIWRSLLDLHGFDEIDVIGGVDPRNPFVFGRIEKAQVAQLFLSRSPRVVGVGDSEVDADMLLLSDHAVVVVNHRQNVDLMPRIKQHRSLWQVVPTGLPHPGIPELTFAEVAALHDRAPLIQAEGSRCR